MKEIAVLKKVIDKSIANGFKWESLTPTFSTLLAKEYPHNLERLCDLGAYYIIIFSHDFAKAFWGVCYHKWGELDRDYGMRQCELCKLIRVDTSNKPRELWKERLQQMVLEKNPLLYLEKFL